MCCGICLCGSKFGTESGPLLLGFVPGLVWIILLVFSEFFIGGLVPVTLMVVDLKFVRVNDILGPEGGVELEPGILGFTLIGEFLRLLLGLLDCLGVSTKLGLSVLSGGCLDGLESAFLLLLGLGAGLLLSVDIVADVLEKFLGRTGSTFGDTSEDLLESGLLGEFCFTLDLGLFLLGVSLGLLGGRSGFTFGLLLVLENLGFSLLRFTTLLSALLLEVANLVCENSLESLKGLNLVGLVDLEDSVLNVESGGGHVCCVVVWRDRE